MRAETMLSILVLGLTLYAVRMLPLTLLRHEIKSKWVRSFLYYVPYVTLSVMTFPAILSSTGSVYSAWAGFLAGIVLAYIDGNLFRVAICSCIMVYVAEWFFH